MVLVLLSSVLLFYFITFSGLSKSYSINKLILRQQQNQALLKDFLLFAVKFYIKNPALKYPAEVLWNNFIGVIEVDSEKSKFAVSVRDNKKIIGQIEVIFEKISQQELRISQAKLL